MIKTSKRYIKQNGIFEPLLAVIALSLLTFIGVLGYDVVKIKLASYEGQRFADDVCFVTSQKSVIHKEAVKNFRNEIRNLLVSNNYPARNFRTDLIRSRLITAILTIPPMPDEDPGDFNPYSDSSNNYLTDDSVLTLADNNFDIRLRKSSREIDFPVAGTDETVKIGFLNGSSAGGKTTRPIYDSLGAGATVGCEFIVQAEGLWLFPSSKKKTMVFKSVFHSYVRGIYPVVRSVNYVSTPGLTIGIVPYMPASAQDPAFRFFNTSEANKSSSDSEKSFSYTDFLSKYSPLHIFSPSFTDTPKPAFGWKQSTPTSDLPNIGTKWGTDYKQPSNPEALPVISPKCDNDTCNDQDGINVATKVPLSPRDELLVACMNPATLTRNIMLSTILELASRHGQLRSMTEVLIANPQRRDSNTVTNTSPSTPPIVIVPFSSSASGVINDIAEKKYTLPFLTFYDNNGQVPATMQTDYPDSAKQEAYSGVFAPDDTSYSNGARSQQALVLGQLRYCQHLYFGDTGLKRFDIAKMDPEVLDNNPLWETSRMFPGTRTGFNSNNASLFPSADYDPLDPSKSRWDTDDILNHDSNTGRLSAAELVSTIGSVLLKPAASNGMIPNSDNPTAGPYDMRGDVYGLVKYWLGASSNGGKTVDSFGIKIPGFFQILTTWPPYQKPYEEMTNNTLSSLLLVLHRRLDPGEVALIKPLILNSPKRLVTVVYLPTRWEDDSSDALTNIRAAFNISDNPSTPTGISAILELNRLIYTSPKNTKIYPLTVNGTSTGTLGERYNIGGSDVTKRWIAYRRFYWDRLVGFQAQDATASVRSKDNPVNWGSNIFYNYILRPGPRL